MVSERVGRIVDNVFFVAGLALLTAMAVQGCAAVKPACAVINLADMACETIAVEYVDPQTGKKVTTVVRKSELTGAVKAAANKGEPK